MDHDDSPVRIAVIVGSTREHRRGRSIADWFVEQASTRDDLVLSEIDLDDIDLPSRFTFDTTPALADLRSRLDHAEGFVVVTPEYNHSYPAPLKHAIDFAKPEWRRKAVGFVSYGGVSGGLRAVEHLRHVFAELHAHTVRDSVSFHRPWNGFGDDALPVDPEGAGVAVGVLLDELVWWTSALRAARQASTTVG
jgi:NAD(P)H-dependent FMN reductase